MEPVVGTEGTHFVVEASGCSEEILSDPKRIEQIFKEAARAAKMTVKASHFFRFSPKGVSGAVIVAESHISIHTWPELGYAAIDVYTCGDSDPEKAVDYILKAFGAKYAHVSEIHRGIREEDGTFTHTILTWEETEEEIREG
ncbi:MAG: S-adenosylmethionine decarboxylase [Candidatus Diapherotrites archaeon]|nr:S-adenosylmethionine decarboxylase [Candidatus Diapherotrites archaeon]MDN5366837.1 S-adenosylmethionine decarboxylase [Candidatus Diapherotrites archaeon]